MLILGIVLNVFGIGFFCWLLFTLAVCALPYFAGMKAGHAAFHSGSSVNGALIVAILAGGATLAIGQIVFATVRTTPLGEVIRLLHAVPATIAGYHASPRCAQYRRAVRRLVRGLCGRWHCICRHPGKKRLGGNSSNFWYRDEMPVNNPRHRTDVRFQGPNQESNNVAFLIRMMRFLRAIALAGLLSLTPAHADSALSLLADLAGHWAGGGTVTMANGLKERLHCRATYAVNFLALSVRQSLRCASNSSTVNLTANLEGSLDGSVAGSWQESSHGKAGSLSGQVRGSRISMTAIGPGVSARMAIQTQGRTQSISIRFQGVSNLTAVTLALHKG
jgi:hypothetical protein